MKYKILIPQDIEDVGKKYLLEKGYEIVMGTGSKELDIINDIKDCHGVLLRTAKINKKIIKAAKNLKVISRHGIGTDNIDISTATEKGIYVTNGPLTTSTAVSEFTLSMLMTLAKKNIIYDKEIRENNFGIRNQLRCIELKDKVLGLVGFGKIGQAIAEKVIKALDMKVLVYHPRKKGPNSKDIKFTNNFDDIFLKSDFVSLHTPLTEETKRMITIKEFKLMKSTAYFINTSRGEIIVEKDLIEALDKGLIAGAALDVFEEEPLDSNNPLLRMENVILSPHVASNTKETLEKMSLHAAIGIDEVLSGKNPSWPVNEVLKV